MGWLEARKRYSTGETLADQRTEDLVARRVLRGMGCVARQLPQLERAIGIKPDFDEALWPRTREVLKGILAHSGKPWFFGPGRQGTKGYFALEVRETDVKHKAILDIMTEFGDLHVGGTMPLFLTRVKNTQASLAYFLVTPLNIPNWLTPPVEFLTTTGDWWVGVQGTEHFISQLGPYNLPPLDENENEDKNDNDN